MPNAALDEKWTAVDLKQAEATLLRCPWMSLVPGIQEPATNGFGLLLSDRWLTSTVLGCMLDVVRHEYRKSTTFDPRIRVVDSNWVGLFERKGVPRGRSDRKSERGLLSKFGSLWTLPTCIGLL